MYNTVTHRCKVSLENETPIRYEKGNWELFNVYRDWDYDTIYLRKICKIEYCPFCGHKLERCE